MNSHKINLYNKSKQFDTIQHKKKLDLYKHKCDTTTYE